jgi:AhpD family alkylhydroperoxidase
VGRDFWYFGALRACSFRSPANFLRWDERALRGISVLELIKLRASQISGCAFCVQYHILQAESLGVPTDKLNLVVVWREAPQFSAPGPKH